MTFKDDIAADSDVFYDTDEFADMVGYNGRQTPLIIDDSFERYEGSVVTNSFNARIRKTDVAQPYTEDKVIIDGYQYRVGEGFYLSGDDWVLTLTPDYIEF